MPISISKFFSKSLSIIVGGILALGWAAWLFGLQADNVPQARVQFPTGYREWVHVKSAVIGPAFPAFETEGGIHHVYANRQALAGLQSGTFEDGSILVYDLLSLSEKSGVSTEGARRRIDVMVKDAKLYPESGGWGFGRFMGEDRDHEVLTPEQQKMCFGCHQNRKEHGFVFSDSPK
jgi:hypothetical protein